MLSRQVAITRGQLRETRMFLYCSGRASGHIWALQGQAGCPDVLPCSPIEGGRCALAGGGDSVFHPRICCQPRHCNPDQGVLPISNLSSQVYPTCCLLPTRAAQWLTLTLQVGCKSSGALGWQPPRGLVSGTGIGWHSNGGCRRSVCWAVLSQGQGGA